MPRLYFSLFEGVFAEVLTLARTNPGQIETLRRSLGEHGEVVSAALPQLGAQLGWPADGNTQPEAFGDVRGN